MIDLEAVKKIINYLQQPSSFCYLVSDKKNEPLFREYKILSILSYLVAELEASRNQLAEANKEIEWLRGENAKVRGDVLAMHRLDARKSICLAKAVDFIVKVALGLATNKDWNSHDQLIDLVKKQQHEANICLEELGVNDE